MAFIETPRFDERLSFGFTSSEEWRTEVVITASGYEQRNAHWAQARRTYDAQASVVKRSDFASVKAWYHITQGRLNGFRLKDWSDYTVSITEGVLGSVADGEAVGTAGAGYGNPLTQLFKRYAQGATYYDRLIAKPVSPLIVYRNGSPVTVGIAAGNIAIDYTTGGVTFVADASAFASGLALGATTQVALIGNVGGLTAGQRLYLSGFTGADADLLNGQSHLVNSVTGSGPYTFTLATSTLGATITLGVGLGARYPQASETLTWSGEFDVPVRFDTDKLSAVIVNRKGTGDNEHVIESGSIPLVELRI